MSNRTNTFIQQGPQKLARQANADRKKHLGKANTNSLFQKRTGPAMTSRRFVQQVQGKVVEKIMLSARDGEWDMDIDFQDKTGLHIRLIPRLELESAEVRDWTIGEGTLVHRFE